MIQFSHLLWSIHNTHPCVMAYQVTGITGLPFLLIRNSIEPQMTRGPKLIKFWCLVKEATPNYNSARPLAYRRIVRILLPHNINIDKFINGSFRVAPCLFQLIFCLIMSTGVNINQLIYPMILDYVHIVLQKNIRPDNLPYKLWQALFWRTENTLYWFLTLTTNPPYHVVQQKTQIFYYLASSHII